MSNTNAGHDHVFLGAAHAQAERRSWMVIILCAIMMVAEIVGGLLFGSIALVADGLHMSTHASALLLAALAYSYARQHAHDRRFTFGTGKLGDLAGFTSAIVLAMIALLIGYEAITRFMAPVPIRFDEAITIAVLGLAVNVASVLLLSGGHAHGHGHDHGAHDHAHDEEHQIEAGGQRLWLSIFEDGVPPRFRLAAEIGARPRAEEATIETLRPGGARQIFALEDIGEYLQSIDEIPEPHAFTALVRLAPDTEPYRVVFEEHADGAGSAHRDNNLRAAVIHVLADAAVSLLVIAGLLLGRMFGWNWLDPVVGLVGAFVIAAWSYSLIRDTSAILLDMNPDLGMAERMRTVIEVDGDHLTDLHLWRLGPGHLGAVLSVATAKLREPHYYHRLLARFSALSHVTVEVQRN
ncbi:MAG: CDF family Co(II)/Ni(II) efflux transporter DmeF [Xanthobacteraceae bacterium]|nr:CDF family Co(II)/Ni(II) efflux transporter DmeF [Xanthobacteraceae bacterium]